MKRRTLTPDEIRMWQHITRQDAPLPESTRYITAVPPKMFAPAVPQDRRYEQYFSMPMSMQDTTPLAIGAYAGIDRNTANRFRKGEYPIDATLDLHGMTREKAHRALCQFMKSHHDRESRCLLVITGKGHKSSENERASGVLRDALPQWLMEPGLKAMVLAFDVAKPKHGGNGAYYILLRRRRG